MQFPPNGMQREKTNRKFTLPTTASLRLWQDISEIFNQWDGRIGDCMSTFLHQQYKVQLEVIQTAYDFGLKGKL